MEVIIHVPRNIQSPNVAADFWAQWSSINPRMALFVLITPQSFWTSVNPVGITSNTRDMTLPGHSGITFKSAPGIVPSVVEQLLDDPANLEMQGIYQTGIFEQADVIAGKWNFATIEVFSACWDDVDLGEFLHFKGKLGEVKDYQYYFTAEARGPINLLSQEVVPVTSRFCRVKEFRDTECGHTASTVTINSVVYNITETGIQPDGAFLPDETLLTLIADGFVGNAPPENYYANGKITAESGDNEGVSREIAYSSAVYGSSPTAIDVQLKRPFPFNIAGTETFTLTAGCARTLEDCMKFGNVINRRAEDWIPTIESANRVPPSS